MNLSKNNNDFFSNASILHIMLLIAAFLFAYFDTVQSLVKTWAGRNDYSHGFIVPFASIYFTYTLRERLRETHIFPSKALGTAVIITGVLMLIFGNVGGIITIQQLSMLIVIPGLVILLLGIEMFKALLLPLGYLVLMVPMLFDVIFIHLHWPFQLFGAKIASMILSALGIPVYHNAQFMQLPNNSLEVANACSGIRYLVSIVALAIPLAYLTQKTWLRKAILVTSSIIIGILANPVRIAIIGLWVHNGGTILHGPGHILQGYFVSVVGFVFLFLMAFQLARTAPTPLQKVRSTSSMAKEEWLENDVNENAPYTPIVLAGNEVSRHANVLKRKHNRVWFFAIAIMLVAGCFISFHKPVPVYLRVTPDNIFMEYDGWKGGIIDGKDGSIVKLPAPDIEMRRKFSNSSGASLYLITAYYAYQTQDKEYIHYTLKELYNKAEVCRLQVAAGKHLMAKRVIIREKGKWRLVTYWYDIDGYETSNNIAAKFITALRGVVQRRTNGSIVLIASDINSTDSLETVCGQQEKFVAAIYPFLKDYLTTY